MAQYHVSCGLAAIYAGTVKSGGKVWRNKSEVTEEALAAVRDWMRMMRPEDSDQIGYAWHKKDGGQVTLTLTETWSDEEQADGVRQSE